MRHYHGTSHSYLTSLVLLIFVSCLCACANQPNTASLREVIDESHFPRHSTYSLESSEQIFALNDDAIAFVDEVTDPHSFDNNKLAALVSAIFHRSKLAIEYSAEANTIASETFKNGAANCLSLTIMAYSMAQYLGFDTNFNEVAVPEFWTRQDGNTLLNGHINLQLTPQPSIRNIAMRTRPFVVDFDPLQAKHNFRTKQLSKRQIVSLFYVNKAAEAMISENHDLSFAYLKAAINLDKRNSGAYLNLGVLYSRNKLYDLAELAYKTAIEHEPGYSAALENLAGVYEKTGRNIAAKRIQEKLRNKREGNPYYHFSLGELALEKEDYSAALKHYKRAISINASSHEFHFRVATVYAAMGDIENTKRYLRNAQKRAKTDELEQRYADKLSIFASR